MRISDWSSDVCSSDLLYLGERVERVSLGRESTPESTDGVAIGALDPVRDAIPLLPRQRCVRRDGAVLVRSPGHRRSEGRLVGTECVSTCRSRWWRYHSKIKVDNMCK